MTKTKAILTLRTEEGVSTLVGLVDHRIVSVPAPAWRVDEKGQVFATLELSACGVTRQRGDDGEEMIRMDLGFVAIDVPSGKPYDERPVTYAEFVPLLGEGAVVEVEL